MVIMALYLNCYYDLISHLRVRDLEDVVLFVGYTNALGRYNEFHITDICESEEYGDNYIDAYCIDKDGEYEGIVRSFKLSRFDSVEISDFCDDY